MKTAFLIITVVALFTAPLAGCMTLKIPSHATSKDPSYEISVLQMDSDAISILVLENNVFEGNVAYGVIVSDLTDDYVILIDIKKRSFAHEHFYLEGSKDIIVKLRCSGDSAVLLKRFMTDRVQQCFPTEIRKKIAEVIGQIPKPL